MRWIVRGIRSVALDQGRVGGHRRDAAAGLERRIGAACRRTRWSDEQSRQRRADVARELEEPGGVEAEDDREGGRHEGEAGGLGLGGRIGLLRPSGGGTQVGLAAPSAK